LSAVCSTAKNNRQETAANTGTGVNMVTATNGLSRAAIHEGDRQLRRTCVRFGEEFRDIRLRAGVSQAAVARATGVVRSVICRVEQGNPDVSPRIRARAAAVLGADLRISIYAESAPLIHDAAHARLVEAVLGLSHPRWRATVESPVPGPGRRSSDIRFDDRLDTALFEVESRVRALEAIIRECAEKRASVAATLGRNHRVHVVLVLPTTRHHKALVTAHPRIVASAFPTSQVELELALADPFIPWPGDGILWRGPQRVRRLAG
jgi:transcriptional regulator with XRE-family HTH domain